MNQSKGQLMLCLTAVVMLLAAHAPGATAQDQNVTGTFVETPPATSAETAGTTPAAEAPALDTTAAGATTTSTPVINLAPIPPPTTTEQPAAEQPETNPNTATGSPATTAAGTTNETAGNPANTADAGSEQQGEAANVTTSRVDQGINQRFTGVRSCLPFNILIAPSQGAAGSSGDSSSGRIVIEADFSVVNSTLAAVEDGILTLSLNSGFESQQAINFTVVMPAGSDLRYVANYGSGLVVLAPGHNSSSIRLVAPTVGQIQALNLTAQSLMLVSNGVLGSSVAGSFRQASITTTVATGAVVLNSSTPVELTVQISGITTVVADVPQGSTIRGTAGGLSKVQHVQGDCRVTSQVRLRCAQHYTTPFLFPVPSIFGRRTGSAISDNKCERVTTAGLRRLSSGTADPRWTCGIIVDGALSCRQGNTSQAVTWNIQNVSNYQPSPNAAGDIVAPNDDMYDPTRGRIIPTGPPPGFNPGPRSSNTAAVPDTTTGSTASAPPGGDTAAPASTDDTAGTAGTTGPTTSTGAGGARKLLQGSGSPPEPTTTQTTNPPGSITTGSFTSGPGTFASGTGTVGDTTQTTTSQGGSPPQTTLTTGGVNSQLFNPVVVPATPPETFSTDSSTNASTAQTTSGTAAAPPAETAATTTTAASAPAVSVSISTMGPAGTAAGVAVVNTMCSFQPGSMLSTLAALQPATAAAETSSGSQGGDTTTSTDAPIVPTGIQGGANTTVASTTASAGENPGTANDTQVVLPVVGGPGETTELTQNSTQAAASNNAGAGSP